MTLGHGPYSYDLLAVIEKEKECQMKTFIRLLTLLVLSINLSGCQEGVPSTDQQQVSDQAEQEQATEVEQPLESEQRVSFFGVGDNLIHTQLYQDALQEDGSYDFSPLYQQMTDDIQAADIAFINQESPISGDEFGFSGYPAFNTPADMRYSLIQAGFDVVAGANNHTMDNGGQGVENTLDLWDEVSDDILFTGVFESAADREDFPILEENGVKIALLSYTYGTNGLALDEDYRTNIIDEELIRHDVARAQEVSDFVLVSMHWGEENTFDLNDQQIYYGQLLADLGVDVVLGGHSHNLQAIEWLEGEEGNQTLVINSLGNFVASPYMDINSLGGAIEFDFVKKNDHLYIDQVQLQPTVIHFNQAFAGDYAGRQNFVVYKLEDYSPELASQNGMALSLPFYYQTVASVIDEEFLSVDFLSQLKTMEENDGYDPSTATQEPEEEWAA